MSKNKNRLWFCVETCSMDKMKGPYASQTNVNLFASPQVKMSLIKKQFVG